MTMPPPPIIELSTPLGKLHLAAMVRCNAGEEEIAYKFNLCIWTYTVQAKIVSCLLE